MKNTILAIVVGFVVGLGVYATCSSPDTPLPDTDYWEEQVRQAEERYAEFQQRAVAQIDSLESVIGRLEEEVERQDTVYVDAREHAAGIAEDLDSAIDSLEVSVSPPVVPQVQNVRSLVWQEREANEVAFAARTIQVESLTAQVAGYQQIIELMAERQEHSDLVKLALRERGDAWEERANYFEDRLTSERRWYRLLIAAGIIGGLIL